MKRTLGKVRKAFRYGEKGFTLIELLIVVAILGILAAVIIPNVSTFMTTGTLNAANTEAENVKTAALAYFAENGVWPADSTQISTANFTAGTLRATYDFDDVNGTDTGFIEGADGAIVGGWGTKIHWDDTLPLGSQKWVRGGP